MSDRVVGPGAEEETGEDIRPLLEGASEYEFVTILNPLTDNFAIRVAQDVPVNMPIDIRGKTGLVQNEGDVIRSYGVDLRNPDFVSKRHISNTTIIPSGHTINLKGNDAQIAVRQLVNELMQRAGKGRFMADPTQRNYYENQVVVRRGTMQEIMDRNLVTPRQQLDDAINRSNEVTDEQNSFPELSGQTASPVASPVSVTTVNDTGAPKKMGRPKKTDSL